MAPDRPLVRGPQLPEAVWINTPEPLTMQALRGRVVLIAIWDFTCVHCLRTLPYLREWHFRYAEDGLQMIGAHAPRFAFARRAEEVRSATGRLGIRWPVMLDNDRILWRAYDNRVRPTVYLLDASGNVRYRHEGEGAYAATEAAIQSLLLEAGLRSQMPALVEPVRPEDAPGVVCPPTTPELDISALGNPAPTDQQPSDYRPPTERQDGRFYLGGSWHVTEEAAVLAAERGRVLLPYQAGSVNAVLGPAPEPLEYGLENSVPLEVQLSQDDQPLPKNLFAEDVYLAADQARVRVDVPRMYSLVRDISVRRAELGLEAYGAGLALYAFSFGSCPAA